MRGYIFGFLIIAGMAFAMGYTSYQIGQFTAKVFSK